MITPNQLLPKTMLEAKAYFSHGPLIPLHYDTTKPTGEAVERDPETMRQLTWWWRAHHNIDTK